jgi:alcohol dehydrogenase class IV
MIDHALAFNVPAVPERFRILARTIDLEPATPESFIAWLAALKGRLGLPAGLGAAGVKREQLDALADLAIADSCHQNNPRPCTREDFRRLYEQAF